MSVLRFSESTVYDPEDVSVFEILGLSPTATGHRYATYGSNRVYPGGGSEPASPNSPAMTALGSYEESGTREFAVALATAPGLGEGSTGRVEGSLGVPSSAI